VWCKRPTALENAKMFSHLGREHTPELCTGVPLCLCGVELCSCARRGVELGLACRCSRRTDHQPLQIPYPLCFFQFPIAVAFVTWCLPADKVCLASCACHGRSVERYASAPSPLASPTECCCLNLEEVLVSNKQGRGSVQHYLLVRTSRLLPLSAMSLVLLDTCARSRGASQKKTGRFGW
jgi:hypothetical protein